MIRSGQKTKQTKQGRGGRLYPVKRTGGNCLEKSRTHEDQIFDGSKEGSRIPRRLEDLGERPGKVQFGGASM